MIDVRVVGNDLVAVVVDLVSAAFGAVPALALVPVLALFAPVAAVARVNSSQVQVAVRAHKIATVST